MKKEGLAVLLLVAISIIWGSTFWLTKEILIFVHPSLIVASRFLIASFVLVPWVWKYRTYFKSVFLPGLCLGGVLSVIFMTQVWGLNFTTATNSGFITGLFLLFVPLFQLVFRRIWLNKIQTISLFISTVGLWFLTGGVQGCNIGDGLTLICAVFAAIQILLVDRFSKEKTIHLIPLNFVQFVVTGLCGILTALFLKEPLFVKDPYSVGVLLYLALIATVFCFFGQLWAQKYLSPMRSTFIFMLEPVSAASFALTLGGESFRIQTLLGGFLILAGIVLDELFKKNQ